MARSPDERGIPQESQLTEQLHALGREVARGSCQFVLERPTTEAAARAEAEIAPLSDREAESA
jgi:hypothetical protein